MKPKERKLAILRALEKQADPISLLELAAMLEQALKERTLRRTINEMIHDGLVIKTGRKRSTKYQAATLTQPLNAAPSSYFSNLSLEALKRAKKPLYERSPTTYNAKWVEAYKPNDSYYLPRSLRTQLLQAGTRSQNADPAGTYAHQIYNRLLIDLSYNSSRLEGNTYSLLDTERLLLSGTGAEGKLDEEKVMILNHKEAIRYLVENAPRLKLNDQTIYTLHYLLADGLLEPKYTGKVRDHWVRISGSTYIPFDSAHQLDKQLKTIIEKAKEIQDPFEKSFFLLVHISYLQPFSDVNKRTARLSANIPLILGNLVPLSFNDIDRGDYMSATVAIYEFQDLHPLIDLFVFSYLRTCKAYDSTVKAMGFDEVRVRFREARRSLIREIIIQKLVGHDMLTYIDAQAKKLIPKDAHEAFVNNVIEDCNQMAPARIAGLGITPSELDHWLSLYKASQ